MNQTDEKPFIVTYWGKEIQLDEAEKNTLVKAVEKKDQYAFLKDGRILSTKFQSLEENPHYVSPESIEAGRKKRDYWYEFQDLKKQGVVTTPEEYVEWKKKSIASTKRFQESLKGEGEKK